MQLQELVKKIKAWPPSMKVLLGLIILGAVYFIFQSFAVYTEDAFITVDTVSVASQVEGRVIAIHVRNNDSVTAGEPLIDIDPTSLTLARDIAQHSLEQAQKTLPVLNSRIAETDADFQSEQARLAFLRKTQNRYQSLFSSGALAKQDLDNINSQVLVNQAVLAKIVAMRMTLQKTYQQQISDIALMKSQLDLAQYNLAQSTIVANQSGTVTSFNTYVGAYLNVGEPLFTLVTSQNWRLIANIKEYDLSDLHPGQRVIIYLSSSPFHLYKGRVHSIAKGVARSQDGERPLNYVDPTVDWIRYDYRFPVTILFDTPPPNLYMGADARVWILK